ncbi:hypothetical protein GGQ08_003151 [Salinibacter ruber]|nr:hypothetical protein [Salinibacter ruber]MCS3651951.1 hypothetical protein [Salinibacter ruber]MCS3655060.1 hypothetical protein [Salinibacter ruber]
MSVSGWGCAPCQLRVSVSAGFDRCHYILHLGSDRRRIGALYQAQVPKAGEVRDLFHAHSDAELQPRVGRRIGNDGLNREGPFAAVRPLVHRDGLADWVLVTEVLLGSRPRQNRCARLRKRLL